MIFSLLNMYNARFIDDIYQNHLLKQSLWFLLGFIILFVLSKLNVKKLFNYGFLFYSVGILLLILVLIFGTEINGAKAWFNFGIISFQPSEYMKLALALYMANLVDEFNKHKKNEFIYIIKITLLTLLPSILVFLEPDTGAIIFFIIILIVALLSSNINKLWYILFIASFIISIGIFTYLYIYNKDILINLIGTSFFYRVDRLLEITNNYQITNALTLIGSASLFGSGLSSISLYVPEAPTDFALAFAIGNFGIINAIIMIFSYYILCINLLSNIKNANNKVFANIFISILFFQIFYNIFMNIGLLPIMGIPLPFLSYGGSALLIYFVFLGITYKNNNYL